jgi:enoyl-CoA hydratase/carnithine racemase
MCLPATIRVACQDAKIGFVFSRRGIVLDACSSYFLPRLIGLSKALHVTATGNVYRASDPLLQPLFSELLPTPERTVERALELASHIAKNSSTVSLKLMRDMMNYGPNSAEETHLLDSKILHQLFGNRDNKEGIESFFEKREPSFKGNVQEDAPEAWPWWPRIDLGHTQTMPHSKHLLSKL